MAGGEVIFTGNVTFAAGAVDLLNPEVRSIFEQDVVSAEYERDHLTKMGYVRVNPLNPNEKFSIEIGAYELDEVTEGQMIPEATIGKGRDKGYQVTSFSDKIGLSRIMKEWLGTSRTLESADSSVKSTFRKFKRDVEVLRKGAIKSRNGYATKILTSGWVSTSDYGPWSATAYGKALFATDHPYKQGIGAGTFDNTLDTEGTADDALDATVLQTSLDIHKKSLRLQNGDRVMTPSSYKLLVSRVGAVNARNIINSDGNSAGMFSGVGTNSAELNTFNFRGNKIEIVELPDLGREQRNGTIIGSDDYFFVANTEAMAAAEALKVIPLIEGEVDVWEDKNTKQEYVSYYESYAMDHFGAESFIVGSRGTA